ncbi:MAG TPA: cysteine desulfurase [Clostridiales bacterium]|nr:cysteine desulfurase [Clostridiales bacterium]
MNSKAYLDNSATTAVSPAAAQAVATLLTENYGNPSSLHSMGINAEREMEKARLNIATALGVTPQEITFTSGGTEANNLAIMGVANARKRMGNRIVTSQSEHSSVISTCKHLQAMGFDVVFLTPNCQGVVDAEDIENAVNEDTILVSLMYVNNEIGAVQPVEKLARIIKRKNAPAVVHCDCVQAFGKIPVKASTLRADIITITAHKIHGPKGTGALYIKKGVRVLPRQFGGEQEKRLRPGTQATPLIGGFGQAVQEIDYNNIEQIQQLNDYLRQQLCEISQIHINSSQDCLPYILNFSVLGIRSETMLHFLANQGVYVSSGSACAKGQKSHVLQAMGLDARAIDSAIRVSFSKYNTIEHIDMLVSALKQGVKTLMKA